jgi:histidinol-phosphate/aromatic aminotransferase/cobyric acid decarboxylase-like protein
LNLLGGVSCWITDDNGWVKVYRLIVDRTVYQLPIINITLENGKAVSAIDRNLTTNMTFSMDCSGVAGYPSIGNVSGTIRGRGNSTWKWDKKPYKIKLDENNNFAMPSDVLEQAKDANLLIITRPNAPTGNSFPKEDIRKIASEFDGILFIDEAYADFADDNCMDLVHEFSNVIVSRTSSKSLALAGLRFGYAAANPLIIEGLNKLKDSYNMDMITQKLAEAAILDQEYLQTTLAKVKDLRRELAEDLKRLGFKLVESQANFIFAAPPDEDGGKAFKFLRDHAVIVRYFPGEVTGKYLRITVGTAAQNQRLIDVLKELYK